MELLLTPLVDGQLREMKLFIHLHQPFPGHIRFNKPVPMAQLITNTKLFQQDVMALVGDVLMIYLELLQVQVFSFPEELNIIFY